VVTDGLAEETSRGGCILSGGEQKVNGLPCAVDGFISIFPLTFGFDVSFIHSPATAH